MNYKMDARERLHLLAPNRGGQGDIPMVEVRHPFQGLQDNNYGNALFVQPGQSQLLLRAHGSDDMPHMFALSAGYTIQPEPKPSDYIQPGIDVSPYLVLKFGAGGANMEYELDFLSGMILNVSGTSFDIEVHNPVGFSSGSTTNAKPSMSRGRALPIFAQASMGIGGSGRSSSNPARRTVVVGSLDRGRDTSFQVPNGSVSYNVMTTNPSLLGALNVGQAISDPLASLQYLTAVASSANFDASIGAVPLMTGSRFLYIKNTSATTTVSGIRVVFTIAF